MSLIQAVADALLVLSLGNFGIAASALFVGILSNQLKKNRDIFNGQIPVSGNLPQGNY